MRTLVRNYHQEFCLDQQDLEKNVGLPVLVFDCTGSKGNQYWYYRADGRITRDFLCMGKRLPGVEIENDVQLVECSEEGALWGYEPRTGALQHQQSGKLSSFNLSSGLAHIQAHILLPPYTHINEISTYILFKPIFMSKTICCHSLMYICIGTYKLNLIISLHKYCILGKKKNLDFRLICYGKSRYNK